MSPSRTGLVRAHSDDGDRFRGVLGCQGCRRWRRRDDVHLEPDQLVREVAQPIVLPLRISVIDDDVLTLDPSVLAQPLPERL